MHVVISHAFCLLLAGVTLRGPGMPDLFVPIQRRSATGDNVHEVEVWKSKSPGIDQGEAAAAWFSTYFKSTATPAEYRLVYQDEVCVRLCVSVSVCVRVHVCVRSYICFCLGRVAPA
jgi:hypothetical protein